MGLAAMIIEIPDPTMKQEIDGPPAFIETKPPTLEGLEIRIQTRYLLNFGDPNYLNLRNYIVMLDRLCAENKFKCIAKHDKRSTIFTYTFQQGIT